EEDLRKEKIFHDLVFRPDERSLLAAWHRDWDWDQMTREEVVALMTKEADEVAPGKPKVRVQSLSYTELGLEAGNISFSKEFGPLSLYYDLFEQGAIYFSPDASFLLYPKCYVQNNSVARHEAHYQVYRVDTRTWAEEEILLDRKYSIAIPVERAVWHEWKFTQDGKTAYLLATEGDERGGSDRAFVLLKMDMTTQQTEELRRVPKTRSSEWIPWNRIALSPDEKQIILLEYGEAYDNETEIRVVALRIWDMTTGKTKKIVCKHEGKAYSIARRIIWLSRKTLAISKGRGDGFFFVDI
ncbi:MAG: hypothetical protein LBO68_03645, partial [Synergistaceae bacterium]|nr:hypothetical protein [Synergistaceae bacterium]